VSLTCEIRCDGTHSWWLTRESGVPSLCSVASCTDCAEWRLRGVCAPDAYVVLKVEVIEPSGSRGGWHVGFMMLSRAAVCSLRRIVGDKVVLDKVVNAGCNGSRFVVEYITGMSTYVAGAGLGESVLWRERCTAVSRSGSKAGWSDAVGFVDNKGRLWSWCSRGQT
jgi:hypothetical protein